MGKIKLKLKEACPDPQINFVLVYWVCGTKRRIRASEAAPCRVCYATERRM